MGRVAQATSHSRQPCANPLPCTDHPLPGSQTPPVQLHRHPLARFNSHLSFKVLISLPQERLPQWLWLSELAVSELGTVAHDCSPSDSGG